MFDNFFAKNLSSLLISTDVSENKQNVRFFFKVTFKGNLCAEFQLYTVSLSKVSLG